MGEVAEGVAFRVHADEGGSEEPTDTFRREQKQPGAFARLRWQEALLNSPQLSKNHFLFLPLLSPLAQS